MNFLKIAKILGSVLSNPLTFVLIYEKNFPETALKVARVRCRTSSGPFECRDVTRGILI